MIEGLIPIAAGAFVGALGALIVFFKFMGTHGFVRKSFAEIVQEMRDRGEL